MTTRLPLGSVVVGVDGSSHSNVALSWAIAQATRERRPLVIAHATGAAPHGLTGEGAHHAAQERRIEGTRVVEKAFATAVSANSDLHVETLVRAQSPRHLLIELSQHARVVVIGSRGLGTLGSIALGSVSVAVSSGAHCPVVVARDAVQKDTASIVVGVDGTAASSGALEFAFAQASERGVLLRVVHGSATVPFDQQGDGTYDEVRLAESLAGLREKYVDVVVETEITPRAAVDRLVEVSREADLLVVGARAHHGPAAALLGSVSQVVVEKARCSVAVVHPLVDAH
ncbi:MAG TPA: universal stress protein [Nocardioidaceae bacterium]|nr:universal stress protein [Nocardioidaceae bacterium]